MSTNRDILNNKKFRVVVTGMGQLSSIGQGIPVLKRALLTGQSQFTQSSSFSMLSFPIIAALLQDFVFEKALNAFSVLPNNLLTMAKKAGHRAPLTIQTSLIAALEAWEQAKLYKRSFEKRRMGIVVAGHNTTLAYQYQRYTDDNLNHLSPIYALRFMDSDQIGTLSEVFGVKGEGLMVGGASASGNIAIIQAHRMIQQNLVDICMVVGVLADLSPFELQGFYNIGALGGRNFQKAPEKACRPFDRDREGFIWGQGTGCLILESSTMAKVHGIPFLGEIKGVAIALDANRGASPSKEGEAYVMQQALTHARMLPTDIQYLNTHGTSSLLGDETEIAAIQFVFNEHIHKVWLNSTKSLVGHCLWSAGVIETIATLIQIQSNFVHANLNLENPIDQDCRFVSSHSEIATIQSAMSNSFGFGGMNTSIVFTIGE